MSDVFISYATADRPRAAVLAQALQGRGWSVWWDRTIPPGRQFDEVIEEALDAARCVVVLWSQASTTSHWVKTEAAEAMRRKALIPALIDDQVKIPLEFRRLQAADLTRWNGEASTPEFEHFCAAVAAEIAEDGPHPVPPRPPPAPAPRPAPAPFVPDRPMPRASSKKPVIIGGVFVAVLVGLAVGVASNVNKGLPLPTPAPSPPLGGAGVANSVPAIQTNLVWRDYALAYTGFVSWDGRSNAATIATQVFDGMTQRPLGNYQLNASATASPGGVILSTRVAIPGDSHTPGPHTHDMNLVFEARAGGGWTFVKNCMEPGRCF